MEETRRERKQKKKGGQAEMKIGVGKGDWRDSSNFKKLGAIYTKEVLWAFNRSIIQHISSLLSRFFPCFFSPKLLIPSERPGIKASLAFYHCLYKSFAVKDVIVLFLDLFMVSLQSGTLLQ